SSTSRKGCGRLMPALLTRMSSRPRAATASRTADERVTSRTSGRAFPPADLISPATSSSSLAVRLAKASPAPAAASARAQAPAMPRPGPVTSAVLPSRRKALSADLAGIGFEDSPHLRAGLFAPAGIERPEPRAEGLGIRGIDLQAPSRQLCRSGSIDLL